MDALVRKIKKLQRITPDASWLLSQRSFLLSELERIELKEKEGKKSVLTFPILAFSKIFRPAFAFALGVIIFISSIATVGVMSASQSTLPGDFLYPVKTVIEKTQFTFTSGSENRTKLSIKFASQRMDEFTQLMDKPEKGIDIGKTVKKFTEEVVAVRENITALKEKNVQKAVEVAKLIQAQTPIYEELLIKSTEKLGSILPGEKEQIAEDINNALIEINKTNEVTDKLAEEQKKEQNNGEEQQAPGEIIIPRDTDNVESPSIQFENLQNSSTEENTNTDTQGE